MEVIVGYSYVNILSLLYAPLFGALLLLIVFVCYKNVVVFDIVVVAVALIKI